MANILMTEFSQKSNRLSLIYAWTFCYEVDWCELANANVKLNQSWHIFSLALWLFFKNKYFQFILGLKQILLSKHD